MKNLEEAVEELSLTDDTEKIPYLVGEVFICQTLEDTLVSMKSLRRVSHSHQYLPKLEW